MKKLAEGTQIALKAAATIHRNWRAKRPFPVKVKKHCDQDDDDASRATGTGDMEKKQIFIKPKSFQVTCKNINKVYNKYTRNKKLYKITGCVFIHRFLAPKNRIRKTNITFEQICFQKHVWNSF